MGAADPVKATESFPETQVRERLKAALEKIAADASVLRPPWEPLLDSKRVVGTILVLEDLFRDKRIPPDRVVRKGGYGDVNEAVADITERIRKIVGN